MKQKKCTNCEKVKGIADFYYNTSAADNHSKFCRKCTCIINKQRADNRLINPSGDFDILKFMDNDSRIFLDKLPINLDYVK